MKVLWIKHYILNPMWCGFTQTDKGKNCYVVLRSPLGKWNAMWLFDIFPQLKHWSSNYMRHEILICVYFTLKVVVKRKEWSHSFVLRAAIWTEVFIQRSVMPHQRVPKQHSLFECAKLINTIWKMTLRFLSEVTIQYIKWKVFKVIKTMLYLLGTHA